MDQTERLPSSASDLTMCYVCDVDLPPHKPAYPGDDGRDASGHRFCSTCLAQAWEIVDATGMWRSSEDVDLWRTNCAVEGLKRGRRAARA